MSNSFLTKKFLCINNKYIYIYYGSTNHNKSNTNNKLKGIKKKLLNKHRNTLYDNTKQWLTLLPPQIKAYGQWPHSRADKIFKQINKLHSRN